MFGMRARAPAGCIILFYLRAASARRRESGERAASGQTCATNSTESREGAGGPSATGDTATTATARRTNCRATCACANASASSTAAAGCCVGLLPKMRRGDETWKSVLYGLRHKNWMIQKHKERTSDDFNSFGNR
jgi:hypothetical protein